ncbi:MAG: hemerythrin family protein [Candidatus Peribacteraceae bacterium]|jgi:hemerythrin
MDAKLVWEARYSVGLDQIDEQHQEFFRILNVMGALADTRDIKRADVLPLLQSLSDYAFYHFASEEEYLERYRYPGIAFHRRQHDIFRDRIALFLEEVESSAADLPSLFRRIVTYAREWLVNHILVEDKKCEAYFKKGNELPLGLRDAPKGE